MNVQQSETFGVIIVGAGHAGGRAAERLRAFGYDKPVCVVGQEPYRPYERPPLSKALLTEGSVAGPPELLPRTHWEALQTFFFPSTNCVSIDRESKAAMFSNGAVMGYENLILATGLTPRRIPQFNPDTGGLFSVNTFDDAIRLRRELRTGATVLMIGAGFIGLEVAASARKLGADVTIVDIADRPLQRAFTEGMSDWITAWHRRMGVEIACGRKVVETTKQCAQHKVTLDDDRQITADLIVTGVGGTPNVSLAVDAALDVDDGVVVDRACRTSDRSIYAIGDIARLKDTETGASQRLESWKNAEDTAAVAARNICGDSAIYDEVPWFWTDQYDRNIQLTGQFPAGARTYERGEIGDPGYLAYFAEGDALRGAFGIDCGRDIRKARGLMEKSRLLTTDLLEKAGLKPTGPPQVPAKGASLP